MRHILKYPNPNLRRPALPVQTFDAELAALSEEMLALMYEAEGIGLAAPQIDVSLRLVVVDLSDERDGTATEVFVNPSYRVLEGSKRISMNEGCLSVPGLHVEVQRYASIEFEYQNLKGETVREQPRELRAMCLQHELDHLDGRLIVDYLERMQLARYNRLLQKEKGQLDLELIAAKAPRPNSNGGLNQLVSVQRI